MATTAAELKESTTRYVDNSSRNRTSRLRLLGSRNAMPAEAVVFPFYPGGYDAEVRTAPLEHISVRDESDEPTRYIQVVVAALALLVMLPLLAVIALAIKLTSRGPVLYKQPRIGLDRRWNRKPSHQDVRSRDLGGRPFEMYKFRTMVTDAEKDHKEVWATRGDRRVTAVGRLLRASRLDELPQLLNVLQGDMNIVGPRPERPGIFAELREMIPNYQLRQRVMPGITGWAQINQSYDTCVDDVRRKVAYDLEYLQTRSVLRDVSIMARTVPVMVFSNFGW